MAGYDNHFDPTRTFKAAVHAVCLAASMSPTDEARIVGKKFRRAAPSDDERAAARRKLRAAVYTVLAANQVHKKPDERAAARRKLRAAVYTVLAANQVHKKPEAAAMSIHCESDYDEPVYEWEDTAVPENAARAHFTREVSLEVEDLFANQEDYLRKIARLKYDRLWKKQIGQKLKAKNNFQAVAFATMQVQELNRVLYVNMHPRNQYRGLEYILAAAPVVVSEVKSRELHHKFDFQMHMRQKLCAAVCAVLAAERLKKLRAARPRRKMRSAVYAILVMIKFNELARVKAKLRAKAVTLEWENLAKCHRHAMLYRQVCRRLDWLGTHIPPLHLRHTPYLYHKPKEDHSEIIVSALEKEEMPSCTAKLAWAVDSVVKASE